MRGAYLLLAVALGCGPGAGEDQVITLEALGLHLTENPYALKPGALVRADNASIERVGVIQSARGWESEIEVPFETQRVTGMTFFKGNLLYQYGVPGNDATFAFKYWNGSSGGQITGANPVSPAGRRMRFVPAADALFYTTSTGVKKLTTYDATPTSAGGLRPLYLTGTPTGTSGFLGALRSTAFRVVWSVKDTNGYVIQGPPSQYEIVTNSAIATSAAGSVSRTTNVVTVDTDAAHGLVTGDVVYIDSTDANFPAGDYEVTVTDTDSFTFAQSGGDATSAEEIGIAYTGRDVSLQVHIPSEITSTDQGYYAEVFRSYDQTPDALSTPTDEMGKVAEIWPTNVDITDGYFTFTDSTPDALVQVPLYSNATEEGLAQANDPPPPLVGEMGYWHGHMFFGDVETESRFMLSFLTSAGLSGARVNFAQADTDSGVLVNGVNVVGGAVESLTSDPPEFKVYTSGTPSENVINTAKSFVRAVNAASAALIDFGSDVNTLVATYVSGPNDPPGMVLLSSKGRFSLHASQVAGTVFAPELPADLDADFTRATNVVTADTGSVEHGYVVGQTVYVFGDGDLFPDGAKTVTAVTDTTFTYSETGSDGTAEGEVSSREDLDGYLETTPEFTNRLYYSKYGLPEAVPALNYIDVGAPDDTIRRIVPLRDSLFIFMEKSGLWRLSGQEPFYLDQFDSTVRLLGDENLAVLDNKIVALTAKGVVTISESGVSRPISYPIEKGLLDLTASALSAVKNYGFALALESSRKFVLYLPESSSDTYAKQKFVYHLDTQTWTEGTDDAYFGAVDETNDILYLSRGTTIEKERKARSTADYQNSDASGVGFDIKWAPFTAGDLSVVKHWPEISVLLTGNSATTFTAWFSTDLSTSEESVSVTGVPANGSVRVSVPLEKQRGGELNVRLTHSTASECLSVAGLKIKYTSSGGPVGR